MNKQRVICAALMAWNCCAVSYALDARAQALIGAVARGDVEKVKLSLANGASVDTAIPPEKMTVLMLAATYGKTEVVRTLIDHHANVNAIDTKGQTAVMSAARVGNAKVIGLLASNKANLNAQTVSKKETALHIAIKNSRSGGAKYVAVVNELIKCKVNVNIRDRNGWTPLARAKAVGNQAVAKRIEAVGGTLRLIDEEPSAETAELVLQELKTIYGAIEVFRLAKSKPKDAVPRWEELAKYMEVGSPLRIRKGKDVLGNPYQLRSVRERPAIDPRTAERLKKFIEASKDSVKQWQNFMPDKK